MRQRGLIVIATGEYNIYMESLIASAKEFFGCHIYIFTDKPNDYAYDEVTSVYIPHFGWPKMPLLRFELLHNFFHIFKEPYLYMIDAEALFLKDIRTDVIGYRVGTLHRNIMRTRDEFNFEKRRESTAFIGEEEGEKYYACGFVGGAKNEMRRMCEVISANIRADIRNGIRAVWGDESHLNRYFIDNRPTLILPPNFMCPEGNPHFIPFIQHRRKDWKDINRHNVGKYLTIDKNEYDISNR